MADLQGYSFSPGFQQRFRGAVNSQPNQLPQNTSQALQVLSLRLPSFIGGNPIAPDALLNAGGQMRPDAAVRAATTGTPATAPPVPTVGTPPAPSSPASAPLSVSSPAGGGDISSLINSAVNAPAPSPGPAGPSSPFGSTLPVSGDTGPAPGNDVSNPTPGIIFRGNGPNSTFTDIMNSLFGNGGGGNAGSGGFGGGGGGRGV